MSGFAEQYCECSLCETEFLAEGNWHGDGWFEPREFEPFDDPVLCDRCKDGNEFTITFRVVGYEDFSQLPRPIDWLEYFEGFDSVHIQTVEVKQHERKD